MRDIDYRDGNGGTLLHAAAAAYDSAAVTVLIAAGADMNARVEGFTPLQIAVNMGSPDVISELVAAGADTRGMNEDELLEEMERIQSLDPFPFDEDDVDEDGIDDDGDDDDPEKAKKLPDLRLPLSPIAMRFFEQIKDQTFTYFACYASSETELDRPVEIFVLYSEKHNAYALLFDEMGCPGVWLNYLSTYVDGTSYWLTNSTERQWLPSPESVGYEIASLNDPTGLLQLFLGERPDRPMVPVSGPAFDEWLDRTFQDWSTQEEAEPDEFDPLGLDPEYFADVEQAGENTPPPRGHLPKGYAPPET